MPNNITELFRRRRQARPPQYHRVFYYLLDFDRNQFYMFSQLRDKDYETSIAKGVMIPLGSRMCLKYRFYHTSVSKTLSCSYDGKACVETKITIKEEMSRNEFFAQYALGTLEGAFIATQDVEQLRKHLAKNN